MQEASPHNQARSRLLKLYSSYRLFLSALLLWLGQLDSSPIYLGKLTVASSRQPLPPIS